MNRPTIKGMGSGKASSGSARVPVEAKDSLRAVSYARVVDLISEGEIEGLVSGMRSIYLNGTPIQNKDDSFNFTGVTVDAVNGTQSQGRLTGFNTTDSEFAVSTEVKFGVPVVKTVTNATVDAVRVRIGIPALTEQNTTNGDLNGTSVTIALDVQSNGGGYVAQYIGYQWLSSPIVSTVGSVGLMIGVEWTFVPVTVPSQRYIQYTSVNFDVQYRQVGGGGWTTIKQDSVTNAQVYSRPDGRVSSSIDTVRRRSYTVTGLPELIYEVRVVVTSGSGTAVPTSLFILTAVTTDTITGKTTSAYQRSYRLELTGSPPWDIRMRRITADSVSSALQNKTYWDSYAELIDEKFNYPNSALVGVKIDAAQFTSVPTRGYEVKLLKVKIPDNYNPTTRVYTGNWSGTFVTAWTDNPAWCFYDMVTNPRYGLGNFVPEALVDKFGLYTIAQYCDGLVPDGFGGEEPRFTCNVYFQTQVEAYQMITTLASIFRGMAYWAEGLLTAVQDAPSDPVFLFTEANVQDGLFTYTGSAKQARHTVALVSWNDPDDGYKLKPEYVEDLAGIARYGVVQTELTAVGAVSRGQAHRAGQWLLLSERLETEVVSLRCGQDGIYVRPGSIFAVQDQHRTGIRYGGRITATTTNRLLWSEQYDNADWSNVRSSITPNTAAGPFDGTSTADKLIEDASVTTTHYVFKNNLVLPNSTPITFSVYANPDTRDQLMLRVQEGSVSADNFQATFDLTLGTVIAQSDLGTGALVSATISAVGASWYRCTITGIYATTLTTCDAITYLATGGTVTYTGDGASGLWLWGAQIEMADAVGPYVQTTSVPAANVSLDSAVTIETGQTYSCQVVAADGTVATKTPTNGVSAVPTTVLTFADAFTVAPVVPAVWLLTSSALSPRLYRALSVVEAERQLYEVTGVEHNPSKYGFIEEDHALEIPTFSTITVTPEQPHNVTITESLSIRQNIVTTVMFVTWDPVARATSYKLQYRWDNGNYVSVLDLHQPSAEVVGVIPGFYEVRVTAYNVLQVPSPTGDASRTIYGKTARPPDVQGFVVVRNGEALIFSWAKIPDLDWAYYEIRQGIAWEVGVPVGTQVTTNRFETTTHVGGTYLLKAFDTSGLESVNPAVVVIPENTDINVVVEEDDTPDWAGVKVNTQGDSVGLTLSDSLRWNTLTNTWNTYTETWYGMGTWGTSGTYETVPIDLGVVLTSRVEVSPVTNQIAIAGVTWASLTNPWRTYDDPWGGVPGLTTITYQVATSQDGAAYTSYGTFVGGYYTARAYKFKVTLTSVNENYLPVLQSFKVTIDVPDRVVHFEDAVIDSAGTALVFAPAFVAVQTVTGTLQAGTIGDTFRVTNKSTTGATITVYDAAGAMKAGVVDVDVFGYGSM